MKFMNFYIFFNKSSPNKFVHVFIFLFLSLPLIPRQSKDVNPKKQTTNYMPAKFKGHVMRLIFSHLIWICTLYKYSYCTFGAFVNTLIGMKTAVSAYFVPCSLVLAMENH